MGLFDAISDATGIGSLGSIGLGTASSIASAYADWRQNAIARDRADTAHQREVRDLIAAGLNPILSGTGGSGSSNVGAAPIGSDISSGVDLGVHSALQAKMNNQQIDLMKAQIDKTKADKLNTDADTKIKKIMPAQIDAQTRNVNQDSSNKIIQSFILNNQNRQSGFSAQQQASQAKILESQVPGAVYQGELDQSFLGRLSKTLNLFNPFAHSAASVTNATK